MTLYGGVSMNNMGNMGNMSSLGGMMGGSSSGSSDNSGQVMGPGGQVKGGNAPGYWNEIKKEIDARKASIGNAMENYADNLNSIAASASQYRPTFSPTMTQMPQATMLPINNNLYNYLTR